MILLMDNVTRKYLVICSVMALLAVKASIRDPVVAGPKQTEQGSGPLELPMFAHARYGIYGLNGADRGECPCHISGDI